MLGDNIRKWRKARGLKLEELADKINSSSGTISHIENGSRNPSLEMLDKIAEALDVTTIDLMAGDSQAENSYFNKLNTLAFPGNDKVNKHLNKDINNNIEWGQAALKEEKLNYGNFPLEDLQPITVRAVKVPVLGRIPAGLPIEAKENVIDYVSVPENEVNNGYSYFFLQVQGDSMINSGIKNGYRVLVKRQPDVESGEIAVVRVNSHDATLKRVKKINGQVILYPDNPDYDPIFIKEEDAEIIGKVIRVEFDPNKKY